MNLTNEINNLDGEVSPYVPVGTIRCPTGTGQSPTTCNTKTQPPVIKAYLKDQLIRLQENAINSIARKPKGHREVDLVKLYTQRIHKWIRSLSPSQQQREFSIKEIMVLADLRGHYRKLASVQYTAEALRNCGFKQNRNWKISGRNKRFWKWSQYE